MKFELLFFPNGCFACVAEAYICALPSVAYSKPDPRSDHVLLTSECTSETECHRQIDALIGDLRKLKITASKKFKKGKQKADGWNAILNDVGPRPALSSHLDKLDKANRRQ